MYGVLDLFALWLALYASGQEETTWKSSQDVRDALLHGKGRQIEVRSIRQDTTFNVAWFTCFSSDIRIPGIPASLKCSLDQDEILVIQNDQARCAAISGHIHQVTLAGHDGYLNWPTPTYLPPNMDSSVVWMTTVDNKQTVSLVNIHLYRFKENWDAWHTWYDILTDWPFDSDARLVVALVTAPTTMDIMMHQSWIKLHLQ